MTARENNTVTTNKFPLVSLAGEQQGEVAVPEFLNRLAPSRMVAQAVHTGQKRSRIRRAHTKERAEVRGGGRKPWRQKGTGRARHGSRRSPLWVGGGATFGPRSHRSRVLPTPRPLRRRALASVLTELGKQGRVSVVQMEETLPQSTREMNQVLPVDSRGLLIVTTAERYEQLKRVVRNLPKVRVADARMLTVDDVVLAQSVWIDEAVMPELESRLASSFSKT